MSRRGLIYSLLFFLTALTLVACGAPDTGAAEQVAQLEAQVAELQAQLEAAQDDTTVAELEEQLADLQAQLEAAQEEPMEEAEAEPVTIHYLTIQQEDEGWPLLLSQLTETCQAEGNFVFEYEYVPQVDLNQRVQLLAGSNSLPTLFNYESGRPLVDLIESGQVLEIESTFEELGIADELNPAAVSMLKSLVDDLGMYALPMELNVEGFWYNKAIFDEYGLGVPETWDEMMEVAATLQANGVQPFATAGQEGWPITRLINAYVVRYYGPDAMARLASGELSATDAGFIEAATVVAEMGEAGYFGEGVNTLDYGTAQSLFLEGRAAMFYMGSWALRDFNNPEVTTIGAENIGFFNIPLVEGGEGAITDYSINAGQTTSISKAVYDADPEGVGAWLKCVFSQYGDHATEELGLITGFQVHDTHDVSALTQLAQEEIAKALNGFLWFEARFTAETQDLAWSNAQLLVTGDITPEQYMEELQTAVDSQ